MISIPRPTCPWPILRNRSWCAGRRRAETTSRLSSGVFFCDMVVVAAMIGEYRSIRQHLGGTSWNKV